MRPNRGFVAALVAGLALALLAGAAVPPTVGVAGASHGPQQANFTVVPLDDRSPGAENVRYGQQVVARGGTDLRTLERTTATYEEGSFSSCGPSNSETFGIDRGETLEGYQIDESLQSNVKSFTAGEDVFQVEYYGENDFGGSTYFDDGDEFISVANCIDNPDQPGWYRITGTTTGVTEGGERATFGSESHYFWICNCENEAAAREKLGPPPSEPQATATPTPRSTPTTTGTGSDGGDGGTPEPRSTTADQTPTEAASTGPQPTATSRTTATPTTTPIETADSVSTVADDGAATPTEGWDDHVLQTPTASEGPGFGPVPAVLSLLGAVYLVRRRC
jgi:PGF-CTERM protein